MGCVLRHDRCAEGIGGKTYRLSEQDRTRAEWPQSMLEREAVDRSMYGGDWFMAAVWLNPDLRGQGLGRKLVEFGISTVKAENAKDGSHGVSCMTQVVRGNDRALELYKKLGFEVSNPHATIEKEGRVYVNTELKLAL